MNMQHSDLFFFFFLTAICLCIFDAPRVSSLLRRTPLMQTIAQIQSQHYRYHT